MKCSQIPDAPILRAIADCRPSWANWPDIFPVLAGLPWKLQKAKMASLINRGLICGCACGCRGDFALIEKGHKALSGSQSNKQ